MTRQRMDAQIDVRRRCAGFIGAVCVAALTLGGCSDRMIGTYEDDAGIGSLEFQDDGRVYVTMLEMTVVGEYEVDGDRIIIHGPRGAQVLTRDGEALLGGPGMTFVRR